jgi:aspartate/methionine/tyrosine aminotransferase
MKIPPFELERFFVPYEFSTQYLLGSSDCQSMSINDLLALENGASQSFGDVWLGYTEYEGNPHLRAEIATLYNHIDPAQILVFSGAEEAIFAYMNTAVGSGDHIIVHAPSYQSLYEIARANGCEISFWMADEAQGWDLDLNWLADNIRPNTRAVILNTPHNPTGYLMTHDKFEALINLLRPRGIELFCDEVYRGLEHNSQDLLPAACDKYELATSLGVMSKTYGLAGLRIGWIATRNRARYEHMAQFKDYTTICNSAPSEFLSLIALRQRETIVKRNLEIIHHNLTLLDDFFVRYESLVTWQRPRAGAIGFPRLKWDVNSETFCVDLIEKRGVMLLPSTCFFAGDKHVRLGFGRANMAQALAEFEIHLHQFL